VLILPAELKGTPDIRSATPPVKPAQDERPTRSPHARPGCPFVGGVAYDPLRHERSRPLPLVPRHNASAVFYMPEYDELCVTRHSTSSRSQDTDDVLVPGLSRPVTARLEERSQRHPMTRLVNTDPQNTPTRKLAQRAFTQRCGLLRAGHRELARVVDGRLAKTKVNLVEASPDLTARRSPDGHRRPAPKADDFQTGPTTI